MTPTTIGIDIAKLKFDVARLAEGKYKHAKFANTPDGFASFVAWLRDFGDADLRLCMEATGAYGLPLAEFLVEQGYFVCVVNPAQIHAFGKSELSRVKTDKADAKLIARYALQADLIAWKPLPANLRALQALTRRLEHLLEMQRMEQNRLETADKTITPSINTVLLTLNAELKATRQAIHDHIDNDPDLKQQSDLLTSIPGIGPATITYLLVALSSHHGYANAKQVVAQAGLAPAIAQSGQWQGKTRIAKTGDARLRKALYLPALVAWRHNPIIRAHCQRMVRTVSSSSAPLCANSSILPSPY